MALQRMLSGDPSRNATLYLVIGAISLAKAIALRDDRERFRRELLDAGLFLGAGLVMRRYSRIRAEKRAEMMDRLPDWVAGQGEEGSPVRALAARRFGSEPEPEPSLRDRAMQAISGRR